MARGKVATKSRWTIDAWPRKPRFARSWKLIDRGLPVRRRGKAVHDGDGGTLNGEWNRWSDRRGGEWRGGSKKFRIQKRRKERKGAALWKSFPRGQAGRGKLVEKCAPRSENMRKIVKQIRVLNFGESLK